MKLLDIVSSESLPVWIWGVVAMAIGLLLVLPALMFLVVRRVRQHRLEREASNSARHRSKAADSDGKAKVWTTHTVHHEQRLRAVRDKDRISLKKKKKAKEADKKRRREPLGEDAIRMRWDYTFGGTKTSESVASHLCLAGGFYFELKAIQ